MKKLLLASTVLASFAAAGTVYAADVGEVNHDWSGVYVGLTAGVATNDFDHDIDVVSGGYDGALVDGSYSGNGAGFIGGGTVGANFQTGSFVFGVEADYSFANASATDEFYNVVEDEFGTITTELTSLGTLRGRIGFAMDHLLVYGTGGFAMGGVDVDQIDLYDDDNSPSTSSTRYGWTAGAGIEYAATENISIKAEALYYDLGSDSLDYGYGEYDNELSGIVARAGLNYNF